VALAVQAAGLAVLWLAAGSWAGILGYSTIFLMAGLAVLLGMIPARAAWRNAAASNPYARAAACGA
jgi:hypothetical protein